MPRKLLSVFLALVMVFSLLPVSALAEGNDVAAENGNGTIEAVEVIDEIDEIAVQPDSEIAREAGAGGVPIDDEHFPDLIFQLYISSSFDDGDDWLSEAEILEATEIGLDEEGFESLESLEGIEYLTELDYLYINGCPALTSIDVSANKKLEELDVINCPALTDIVLGDDMIVSYMNLFNTSLTSLDVSVLPLVSFLCVVSELQTLTLGEQPDLEQLCCYGLEAEEGIAELDISGCPILIDAYLYGEMSEEEYGIQYSGGPLNGVLYVYAGTDVIADVEFEDPVWNWAWNYSKATALFECVNYPTLNRTVNAEITSETMAATCLETGLTTYTASVVFRGESYTDTREAVLPAAGHSYGAPVYTWADDNSSVTATMICTKCGEETEGHSVSETVETTSVVTDPTCEEDGYTTYTATFANAAFMVDSKVVPGDPATGHDYELTGWTWATDYSSAAAVFTCSNNEEHVEVIDAEVTSAPSGATITYTATVTFDGETYSDEKIVDEDTVASGFCGDDLTWTLNVEGLLTISGTGDMWDYNDSDPEWAELPVPNSIKEIVIQPGAESIGDYAFFSLYNCESVTRVMLPETLVSIGADAFEGCILLESITIPDSVTSIGELAFGGCSALTDITLSNNAESIGGLAFQDCTALTEVTIPASVKSVGMAAFCGCTGLTSITFLGNAPTFIPTTDPSYDIFTDVTAMAYYPAGNETWTNDVMKDYGGTITWMAVTQETPSNITSSSVNFDGKMELITYIKLSDEMMADENAYVSVTFNDETTDHSVADLIQSLDSQGRVKVRQEMYAAMMRDEMTLQVLDGQGRVQPLTYKETTDVTDGFVFTALEYLKGRQEQSTNPYMVELARAAELYGIAVQVKFDYHTDLLTEEDVANMEAAAGDITIPATCDEEVTGALPAGITKQTKTVMFESDNTLRLYYYFDDASFGNYAFTLDGKTVTAAKKEAGRYYVQQENIASGLLSTRYAFTVSDGTDTYTVNTSALAYAYGRQENSSDQQMIDLSKLLYRYSQAADAYFGN